MMLGVCEGVTPDTWCVQARWRGGWEHKHYPANDVCTYGKMIDRARFYVVDWGAICAVLFLGTAVVYMAGDITINTWPNFVDRDDREEMWRGI